MAPEGLQRGMIQGYQVQLDTSHEELVNSGPGGITKGNDLRIPGHTGHFSRRAGQQWPGGITKGNDLRIPGRTGHFSRRAGQQWPRRDYKRE